MAPLPSRPRGWDLQGTEFDLGRWTLAIWRSPFEGAVQTVNRAELSACIAALRVVPRGQALRVLTDSRYVCDGAHT